MSEKDTFVTTSDCPVSNTIALSCVFAVVGALFAFIAHGEIQLKTMIIAGVVYIVFAAALVAYTSYCSRWELRFEGDKLYLRNLGNRREYEVYDVPASAFVMKCTSKQDDKGSIRIKNTIFNIGDVHRFSSTEEYIKTHFKQG